MSHKILLGTMLALVMGMSTFGTASPAHAGRLGSAIGVGLEGDRRALHDLACGEGPVQAARDAVGGARIGLSILRHGGGGGFGKQKPC
jgi:hypothetical protein